MTGEHNREAAPDRSSDERAPQGYAGARALVLGASGFIGRAVARALSDAGANLTCAVRDVDAMRQIAGRHGIAGDVVAADFRDPAAVEDLLTTKRPAIVFNLAGYGIDRSETDEAVAWRINAELVGQLADLVPEVSSPEWLGLHLVHTGSALEYGPVGGHLLEDGPAVPNTLYGRTKLDGTRRALHRLQTTTPPRLRAVVARLFTVYGPGEHSGRLLPSLLDSVRSGTPVLLSAGTQRRDFTYVDDVVEGLLRLGRQQQVPGGVVNLASGHLTSVRAFAEIAAQALDLPSTHLVFGALAQRPDEMPHDVVSVERLRQSISWVPPTLIGEGVLRTARFELGRAGDFSMRPPAETPHVR